MSFVLNKPNRFLFNVTKTNTIFQSIERLYCIKAKSAILLSKLDYIWAFWCLFYVLKLISIRQLRFFNSFFFRPWWHQTVSTVFFFFFAVSSYKRFKTPAVINVIVTNIFWKAQSNTSTYAHTTYTESYEYRRQAAIPNTYIEHRRRRKYIQWWFHWYMTELIVCIHLRTAATANRMNSTMWMF